MPEMERLTGLIFVTCVLFHSCINKTLQFKGHVVHICLNRVTVRSSEGRGFRSRRLRSCCVPWLGGFLAVPLQPGPRAPSGPITAASAGPLPCFAARSFLTGIILLKCSGGKGVCQEMLPRQWGRGRAQWWPCGKGPWSSSALNQLHSSRGRGGENLSGL